MGIILSASERQSERNIHFLMFVYICWQTCWQMEISFNNINDQSGILPNLIREPVCMLGIQHQPVRDMIADV